MANLKETSTWENGIYQIEENDPVHGGENGITNRPAKQLANRTKYLQDNKVQKTTTISAGNGLTGGGDLSANRSLALGTPSQITATSSNSVTAESHSHAIDKASTAGAGIVQLNDTLTSTSTTQALTANQGKILQDTKANKAGESFTGQITAPTIVVGKNQNIAYPSLGFQSSLTNSRFWSLEPASTGFNILSRSAENVQAGQVIYSLIGRDSGSYQLATTADNVASATQLQTPRNINGVAFDGTQNITIADNTKVAKSGDSMTGSLNLLADNTMINVGNNDDIAIIKKSGLGGAIAFGANNRFRVYKSNNARVAPSDVLTQVFEVDANGYATANKFIGALQGNADTATSANIITATDDRSIRDNRIPNKSLNLYFVGRTSIENETSTPSDWGDFLTLKSYSDNSGGKDNALFFSKNRQEIIHYQANFGSSDIWQNKKILAYTDSNVASATQLQTPRTINGVAFDGTQNINIEAPLMYRGNANTAEQLDNAKQTGFYLVNNNPTIANLGLYNYGVLYVYQQGNVVHQLYYAHVPNTIGSCATRITWHNDWTRSASWRIIDTPLNNTLTSTSTTQALTANQGKILQDTKANKAGESFTGQITAPTLVLGKNQNIAYPSLSFQSSLENSRFWSIEPAQAEFLFISRSAENIREGQVIYSLVHRNTGRYQLATTSDNVASATKLQTPRQIALTGAVTGSVNFDGSANVSINTQPNTSNLRVVSGSGYTITYDDHRRIAIIEMTLWENKSVINTGILTTIHSNEITYYGEFTLPITLKKRLSTDIFLIETGVHTFSVEAVEWLSFVHPVGYKNTTESKFGVSFRRWFGGSHEPVNATATIVGIF